ncbi:MAG TPA: hypothetical protein VFO56_06830 [Gaiellaceae bacterium]|nr:hypothetical protein [Gaiellaceae bacterium]
MVEMTAGRAGFERAVSDYALAELTLPDHVLAVAADSLDRTGLFLLGELHGVAQTPNAILGLVSGLHVRALAFEWSYDELDRVVQPVLTTGAVDSDALWALPSTAEVFSGDGRFTAGHVRLLEYLADRLDRIVLLDRAVSEETGRERGMAQRLLAARHPGTPARRCWPCWAEVTWCVLRRTRSKASECSSTRSYPASRTASLCRRLERAGSMVRWNCHWGTCRVPM